MPKVKDKATAFKNELVGSQTNKIVCKASSHDVAGPKKKHVDYLLQLTNHPKCQYISLVDLLAERLKHNSWVVVFKVLIVTHNLMSLGNEKFTQSLATRDLVFELDRFSDKSEGLAVEMSSYLRKYARYVRHLCISYKTLAVDVCRIPKGENSPFRNMDIPKILKSTVVIQDQLDLLLEIEFASNELTNGIINTAFLMLYKDLIKLYTVYNDTLINLLEKFFEMKKSDCKETIGVYRRFLLRQEAIQRFLQLAEDVGVDKDTHLNLRQVPEDLLPALESHMTDMDAAKKASGSQPSPQIQAASERLQELREKDLRKTAPPNQSGSGVVSGFPSASKDILDAQRKRFEELKKRASETRISPERTAETPKSLSKPASSVHTPSSSGVSDVLALNSTDSGGAIFDPWVSSNSGPVAQSSGVAAANPFQSPPSAGTSARTSNNPWAAQDTNGTSTGSDPWGTQNNTISSYQEVDLFSEIRGPDFNTVFGATGSSGGGGGGGGQKGDSQYAMGGILTPQAVGAHATVQELDKPVNVKLTTDVNSSLVLAAANLSVDVSNTRMGMTKKTDHQWNAPRESVKTGGPNWLRQNLQPSTLSPMHGGEAGQAGQGKPVDWSGGLQAGHFPMNPVPSQPRMQPVGMQPMMMGGAYNAPMMVNQPMGVPMQQRPFMQQQPLGMQPNMWPQQQQQPFGQSPLL